MLSNKMKKNTVFCKKCKELYENRSYHTLHQGKLIEEIPENLLNQYIFEKTLGSGAFGVVFKILDKNDEMEYALKFGEYDEENEIEYRILSTVQHNNIIKYYSTHKSVTEGYLAIKLESADYDLKTFLNKSNPSDQDLIRMTTQLCEALYYLHFEHKVKGVNATIIHRDLKPENVLIKDQQIKLTDFGIAKIKKNARNMSSVSGVVGTIIYMPPELIRRLDSQEGVKINDKTDIWSLGIILHEMFAGYHPFADSKSDTSLMNNILENRVKIDTNLKKTNPTIFSIITSCLNTNSENRPDIKYILETLCEKGNKIGRIQETRSISESDSESENEEETNLEEMEQYLRILFAEAIEKFDSHRDMAMYCKNMFQKKFVPGPKEFWHCVVGKQFGSYVTPHEGRFFTFKINRLLFVFFGVVS